MVSTHTLEFLSLSFVRTICMHFQVRDSVSTNEWASFFFFKYIKNDFRLRIKYLFDYWDEYVAQRQIKISCSMFIYISMANVHQQVEESEQKKTTSTSARAREREREWRKRKSAFCAWWTDEYLFFKSKLTWVVAWCGNEIVYMWLLRREREK